MDREELVLMRDVSIDFHIEGKTKVEIAQEREMSRFRVARLLSTARDLGMVKISVELPEEARQDLNATLTARLGVPVAISASHSDLSHRRDLLARTVSEQIRTRVREGITVGVSWSRTIEAAARHLDHLPACEIVQLVGAQPVAGSGNSLELIQQFKKLPGVHTVPIWAPLVVNDAATAAGLRNDPQIAEALRRADSLDVAVVAVGGWSPQSSTVYPTLSPADHEAVGEHAVAGECSGRLFDAEGRDVRTALDDRVVAVSLDQLRRTPTVIACGFGRGPAPAIRAAVRGGFADVLVLDPQCASALADLLGHE